MAATNYTPISLYYSTTAAATPSSGNLVNGELAINITDGKLYYKDNGGTVKLLASNAGSSGDVVGPASATDNAVTRFDGTTGKLVQNSGVTIDDSNLLTTVGLSVTGNTTLGDASTDTVTVNGYMGVGGAGSAATGLRVNNTALTGANQYGFISDITATSAANNNIVGYYARVNTAAATYTTADVFNVQIADVSKGAGHTITNQHGLRIADQTQGTNNYGITSIVSSGTNKWNIYASGTAANYFAGNVGIGTSSPSALLNTYQVNGGGDANIFFQNFSTTTNTTVSLYLSPTNGSLTTGSIRSAFIKGINVGGGVTALTFGTNSSGADPTERMRIDSSGNVGIGTSSPAYVLHTVSSNGNIEIENSTSTGAAGTGSTIILSGNNGSSGSRDWAYISGYKENSTVGNDSSYLSLSTRTSGSAPAERMRIDSSGNVGIGTSSPSSYGKLAVSGGNIHNQGQNFTATAGSGYWASGASTYAVGWLESSGNMLFRTATTERMRIDSSGNVGIGTSSPSYKLDINEASTYSTIGLRQGGTLYGFIEGGSSQVKLGANAAIPMLFEINGTERMRIDSAGNILIAKAVRATITTDNDGSFDMNAASNFKCTPTGNFTLTFTNITSGQTGNIILVNSGGYTISAAATTKVSTTALATISAAGTYWLSYISDGTNVFVANTGALA